MILLIIIVCCVYYYRKYSVEQETKKKQIEELRKMYEIALDNKRFDDAKEILCKINLIEV